MSPRQIQQLHHHDKTKSSDFAHRYLWPINKEKGKNHADYRERPRWVRQFAVIGHGEWCGSKKHIPANSIHSIPRFRCQQQGTPSTKAILGRRNRVEFIDVPHACPYFGRTESLLCNVLCMSRFSNGEIGRRDVTCIHERPTYRELLI